MSPRSEILRQRGADQVGGVTAPATCAADRSRDSGQVLAQPAEREVPPRQRCRGAQAARFARSARPTPETCQRIEIEPPRRRAPPPAAWPAPARPRGSRNRRAVARCAAERSRRPATPRAAARWPTSAQGPARRRSSAGRDRGLPAQHRRRASRRLRAIDARRRAPQAVVRSGPSSLKYAEDGAAGVQPSSSATATPARSPSGCGSRPGRGSRRAALHRVCAWPSRCSR
jgi:hypothetical protein